MNHRNIREQATDRLREEILLGNYEAGTTIREVPLAERYRVSRGPIRDALLQLSQEGLLEYIPNCGMRVRDVWDAKLIPNMAKMRFELESFALTEIIADIPEGFSAAITQNLRMFKLACDDEDITASVHLDLEFHRLLLRECGHPGLESVWLPLIGGLRLPYNRHGSLAESSLEHKAIVDAIEAGDSNAAVVALKVNIYQPFLVEKG